MKILIVRFSSIGDIVLTTPILRALKNQLDNPEIHFLTKIQFASILEENPNVDKIIKISKSIDEVIGELKAENYDHIIDLHNNIRTLSLKRKLKRPSHTFKKLNWKKWLLVKFKVNKMPDLHVVDRYFEAVKSLGVNNDQLPGEFSISPAEKVDLQKTFGLAEKEFICVAIGAQFKTKQMPKELLVTVLKEIKTPIILIGGETDVELAKEIMTSRNENKIFNACGQFSLQGSASIVSQSAKLLTNDTGMMHIAACFNIPIVSVWGNTVPAFGMYPYYPDHNEKFSIHEVEGLSCRPCSKIGFQKCPKGHFNCMHQQNIGEIVKALLINNSK